MTKPSCPALACKKHCTANGVGRRNRPAMTFRGGMFIKAICANLASQNLTKANFFPFLDFPKITQTLT
jgi:hypothetical protein